jgi:hypothetical protein
MKFTLVFASLDSLDLSYGLLFTPTPAWYKGRDLLVQLTANTPGYQPGSLSKLLEKENILPGLLSPLRACSVILHPTGKGGLKDLQVLLKDLRDEGFTPTVMAYNGIEPYDISVSF